MAKKPSFWGRLNLFSFFRSDTEARHQRRRSRTTRRSPFERLEERDLFALTVTPNTSNLSPDAPAIIINGTEFDPIVANNTLTFDNGAIGTVTSATTTQLVVEFTDPPDEAGALSAIVTTTAGNSGSSVQVATIVPKSLPVRRLWPRTHDHDPSWFGL